MCSSNWHTQTCPMAAEYADFKTLSRVGIEVEPSIYYQLDHRLQKSNHSSNSARSEQQDTLTKALGLNHPMHCFLYACLMLKTNFHLNIAKSLWIMLYFMYYTLCVSPRRKHWWSNGDDSWTSHHSCPAATAEQSWGLKSISCHISWNRTLST